MNTFHLLGYDISSSFRQTSKTHVGLFALIGGGVTPPIGDSSIYYGSINITSIYYGSTPVSAIYYGAIKVF